MQFDILGNPLMALGLTLPRIAGAFIMLPLLTQQNMPAMVRNSFLVSLAIIALADRAGGIAGRRHAGDGTWRRSW